jgi:hypothetical protein
MEGAQWSVQKTSITLSKTWDVQAFSGIGSASVWLLDPAAVFVPHLISVYVENRSVVHIGGANLSHVHGTDHSTVLSCNNYPKICVFLSSNVEVSASNSWPVHVMSCNIPIQSQSCESKIVQVPFNGADHHKIIVLSIVRDISLASASIFVSAGDEIYFTVFYWLSGSIAATSMAPLLVEVSQVKASFLCGQFSCILAANGRIYVQNGSSFIQQSMAAIDAANAAFTNDPRCKMSNGKHEHNAGSPLFAVERAWIGDQELVINWGSGCFTAVEWCAVFLSLILICILYFSIEQSQFHTKMLHVLCTLLTLVFHSGRIHVTSKSALLHHGQLVSAPTSSDHPHFHLYRHHSTPWSCPWLHENLQIFVRLKCLRSLFR